LYYGQAELVNELLNKGASVTQTDNSDRMPIDYLMDGYITGKQQKQKQGQVANEKTMVSFWEKIRPQAIVYEYQDRQFRIGSHSMLFFLIILMRNAADNQPRKATSTKNTELEYGVFDMKDMEQFAAMIPDEVLPPYRKKRSYINSVMAMNEIAKDSPYCKSTFARVERGWYILNPEIVIVINEMI
jgi:hypothetical protein